MLSDIAFEERILGASIHRQDPDSHEVRRFSCGHEWTGTTLATADAVRISAERRTSPDTVDPVEGGDEP